MKKLIIIIAILSLSLTACQKFEPLQPENPEDTGNKTLSEATISENFNWQTTKNVEVTLTGSVNDVVKVKASNGDIYHKALLSKGITYVTRITIPTFEKEVTLSYNGKNVTATLEENKIEHTFNLGS
ncbi:MAG: hypothetical protein K9G67_01395 [Bacteroidales bacterium]|nr:hypothetical protein [Bacteroidales bacterium]MCF8344128.1 hypothetical protein [Bacteroidales bacterium]MCF8350069.1 hypothetical protein [Bacteroidales bacterium]MCF8374987.1 hypothetical protein [Bacteroidales bacterium]